jgi:hypothetical protein
MASSLDSRRLEKSSFGFLGSVENKLLLRNAMVEKVEKIQQTFNSNP